MRLLAAAQANRRIRALLDGAAPVSWTDGVLAIFVPANAATSTNAYLADLESLATTVTGKPLRVRVESPQVSLEDPTTSQQRIAEHPLIKQAMELLNARIVGIQPRAPKPPP